MLIEHQEFNRENGPSRSSLWEDAVFRRCNFSQLEIDGQMIGGALLGCELRGLDWYWGLFNTALLAHTSFKNCIFRGSSFAGCEFVQCQFDDRQFALDNLRGPCSFEDCMVIESTFNRCEIIVDEQARQICFVNSRWYGCKQNDCSGFEGLF
jgi:uncharacterized protein YjbI with pentapeptide repeats